MPVPRVAPWYQAPDRAQVKEHLIACSKNNVTPPRRGVPAPVAITVVLGVMSETLPRSQRQFARTLVFILHS